MKIYSGGDGVHGIINFPDNQMTEGATIDRKITLCGQWVAGPIKNGFRDWMTCRECRKAIDLPVPQKSKTIVDIEGTPEGPPPNFTTSDGRVIDTSGVES